MDKFESTHKIHHFQTDAKGDAKITAILDWMQETASIHAVQLGFSQRDLHERGMLWALYRFTLAIDRMPNGGEDLQFSTWVSKMQGPFSEREYLVKDHEGQEIIKGTSLWFAINSETRRPQSLGVVGKSEELKFGPKLVEGPAKLAIPDSLHLLGSTHATYYHLDINNHVNNVRYVDMVLGGIDGNFLRTHSIEGMDVNFVGEVLELHRPLNIFHSDLTGNEDVYVLKDHQDKTIAIIRIRWTEL